MIPKVIHFCQLGPDTRPDVHSRCLEQVTKLHPDWDIRLHTDTSVFLEPCFDALHMSDILFAFWDVLEDCDRKGNQKALQADLLRLCLIYAYGGITLDRDLWFIRNLDGFRDTDLLLAEHRPSFITEAVMGAEAGSHKIRKFIRHFVCQEPTARYVTAQLGNVAGWNGWKGYPPECFTPSLRTDPDEVQYDITDRTACVHLWKEKNWDFDKLKALADSVGTGDSGKL